MAEPKFYEMGRVGDPNPLDAADFKTSIVVHEDTVKSHIDAGWFIIGLADAPSPAPPAHATAQQPAKAKFPKE